MSKLRIAFQNNTETNGLILTPVWFGLHDGGYDLFDRGSIATAGLELIAEDGGTDELSSEFNDNQDAGVFGVITATQDGSSPVFDPGEMSSAIVEVDAAANGHLAFASMLLPSNDAFIGNDKAIQIFGNDGQFLGAQNLILGGENVYDAGTEVNTEFDAPFAPDQVHGDGEVEGGVVQVHEGFKGSLGNPLEPGEQAFILGQQNVFGTPIDQQAADFTRVNFNVGTVHVNEVVEQHGTSQKDTILGGREDDIVNALDGDDLIEGGGGWDVVDGGEGEDTYVIRARLSDYAISESARGLNVSNGIDDNDQLSDIEHIIFNDGVVHVFSDGTLSGNNEDVADRYVNLDENKTSYSGTDGIDALVVNGNSSLFTVRADENGQGSVLQSSEGNDVFVLNNFEYVVFDDASVELDAPVEPTDETLIKDVQGETQYVEGTAEKEVFVIDGTADDYNWGRTQDGEGYVVWNGDDFDILYDVEQIRFNDLNVDLDAMSGDSVADVEGSVQHLIGTDASDTFVIDANSSEYGWGVTQDGEGIVVWSLEQETHDILYDFEAIEFNDTTVDIV